MSSSPPPPVLLASDLFNHYHTQFVKLDANNWREESGQIDWDAPIAFDPRASHDEPLADTDSINVIPN